MAFTMTTNTVPTIDDFRFPYGHPLADGSAPETVDLTDNESLEEGEIPEPLKIPTLDDHRGRGILPGDFIKPDPVMTRQETRRYVVTEMRRWLTESAMASHARDIAAVTVEPAEVAPLVAAGKWPAARLYLVLASLEALPRGVVTLPRDYEERFHTAARFAADVCEDYLHGYEAVIPAARMAVGFVTDDLLPGGKVIADYWNYSPFEALRSAPPLPDHDPAEEESVGFLKQEIVIRFTGGQLAAFLAAVLSYLWLVAALVGRR
jgi:hypothetical protein